MMSGSVRPAPVKAAEQRFFYGWVILAVAALGIFASGPGQSHTFSVFVGPIGRELGIGATAIATAYGVATLAAAFGLPYIGKLTDRYGTRRMLLAVSLVLGLACFAFALVPNMGLLALGFAALRLAGQGSMMLNCSNLVAQWFQKKRGFAMSLMMLGFALSMAVHPALGEWLISEIGWRGAYMVLGVMTWLIMMPLVFFLVFHKPEDVGLRQDGEAAGDGPAQASDADIGLTLEETLRERAFYILCFGLFSLSMLVTTLHFFQVSILVSHGLDRALAASVFTVSALTMIVAMPLYGKLLDWLPTQIVFAIGLLIQASALIAITFAHDPATAYLYGIVFGCNNAVTLTLFGYMWPRYFGRKHLGSIQGTGQMIMVVGASLGPLPAGIAYDLTGSYDLTLRLLALFPAAAAILALTLKTPRAIEEARAAAAAS